MQLLVLSYFFCCFFLLFNAFGLVISILLCGCLITSKQVSLLYKSSAFYGPNPSTSSFCCFQLVIFFPISPSAALIFRGDNCYWSAITLNYQHFLFQRFPQTKFRRDFYISLKDLTLPLPWILHIRCTYLHLSVLWSYFILPISFCI